MAKLNYNLGRNIALTMTVRFLPKLPLHSGRYLVCTTGGYVVETSYSEKYKRFNARDDYDNCEYAFDNNEIVWWIDVTNIKDRVHNNRVSKLVTQLHDNGLSQDEITNYVNDCLAVFEAKKREKLSYEEALND